MGLPDPDTSRAVLVGTAKYQAEAGLDDIPAVLNNLVELQATLCQSAICGFSPQHCVVVADPRRPSDIAVELDHAATVARDTLLVYYAGHGLLDDMGALHLGVTQSTRAFTRFDSFAFQGLRSILAKSAARKRLLILDCCFSGQAIGMMGGPVDIATGQLEVSGTFTLTATPSTEPALSPPGARFTAFTDQLLSVLRHGIPDGPEMLSMMDVYTRALTALAAAGLPKPQQRGTNTAPNLDIARNVARASGTTATAVGGDVHTVGTSSRDHVTKASVPGLGGPFDATNAVSALETATAAGPTPDQTEQMRQLWISLQKPVSRFSLMWLEMSSTESLRRMILAEFLPTDTMITGGWVRGGSSGLLS